MTLEELNAMLALPETRIGKNGPTPAWGVANGIPQFGVQQTNPNKMNRLPFYDPTQPMVEANASSGMEALGLLPNGRGINEPSEEQPVVTEASNAPVVTPAAYVSPPEFYGIESLVAGGPTDITPQGFSDESKRTSSMSKWDQFMSRPGMGNALLAMGGAMLSGKSPADAFGSGITAFGNTLEARRLNDLKQQNAEQDRLMALMAARAKASSSGINKTEEKYTALKRQAAELGLQEGTPEYLRYVSGNNPLPSGSGDNMKFKDFAGAMADAQSAMNSERQLDSVMEILDAGVLEGISADVIPGLVKKFPQLSGVLSSMTGNSEGDIQRTLKFSNIMSQEAISAMASSLKGATTNFELEEFKSILADPSAPAAVKKMVVSRMREVARNARVLNEILANPDISQSEKYHAQMKHNYELSQVPATRRPEWNYSSGSSSGGSNTGTPASTFDFNEIDTLVNR